MILCCNCNVILQQEAIVSTSKNVTPKPSLLSPQAGVQVNARLPEALVTSSKTLATAANESLTDFIKCAIGHEISRRTLCKPQNPVTLVDIKLQLDQLNERLAMCEARDRLKVALLESIAQALDLDA